MLLRKNNFLKYILFFFIGGFLYGLIEIISRGYSHISMFLAGGICFILIGLINEVVSWKMSLISQMVVSAGIITIVELVFGLIVNVWLGLNVWDYYQSHIILWDKLSFIHCYWFLLSPLAIILDDYLRYFYLRKKSQGIKYFK